MARTISRSRLLRGTQSTRTREVVPGDAVAPRRRLLSANGPTRPNRPSDPAELRNRPLTRAGDPDHAPMQRQSGARTRTKPNERAEAPPPKRRTRRTGSAALGAAEPGREGVAASLGNTTVRGPATGGKAARELSKISRVRDGRYGRTRARFIV
jgi:hypothetical protein